jgi:D-serine deaminase-like pyridoxal phosphate-dependent protein
MTRRSSVRDLPTPALLLDLDVLERNIAAMAEKVRRLGARLRPHVKTHKCIEVGRRQREAGAAGITVATLVEAKDFADHGFDDITWAFPVVTGRLGEVVALAGRITFRVLVDSPAALEAVAAAGRAAGQGIHTWLKVDCGYHRAGVDPGAAASLELVRRLLSTKGVTFDGILTHAGHSYHAQSLADRKRIAAQERLVMLEFAARCEDAGLAVPAVSIGSTPTMSVVETLDGVAEVRPGNYVFNDWMQVANGVCRPEDVAVSVLTSVVSHQAGADHVVVDAGALSMSKDLGPADGSRGRGLGPLLKELSGCAVEERLNLTAVSQEHGVVAGAQRGDVEGRFAVGEKIRVVPNHSCLTAALFDEYVVVRGDEVLDHWKILRGR